VSFLNKLRGIADPRSIFQNAAKLPGTPEALLSGLNAGAKGDVSWNPYQPGARSVWDIGAGGDVLSRNPNARSVGRGVGTLLGGYFAAPALASAMGGGVAGGAGAGAVVGAVPTAASGANRDAILRSALIGGATGALASSNPSATAPTSTEGIAQLPPDIEGYQFQPPVENLPSIPQEQVPFLPEVPDVSAGSGYDPYQRVEITAPPSSSEFRTLPSDITGSNGQPLPPTPPPVDNLPSPLETVPPLPEVPTTTGTPNSQFPYKDLLKLFTGAAGKMFGGGFSPYGSISTTANALRGRRQEEPLPTMFDPNYQPPKG